MGVAGQKHITAALVVCELLVPWLELLCSSKSSAADFYSERSSSSLLQSSKNCRTVSCLRKWHVLRHYVRILDDMRRRHDIRIIGCCILILYRVSAG